MNITASEAALAVGGEIIAGNPSVCARGIATDSNKVNAGDLFVPVIGKRTDGHRYIGSALRRGAAISFTSEEIAGDGLPREADFALIRTGDTVAALQRLAAYRRDKYVRIPLIGVTGSVGKTTTREMTAAALSPSFNCYATRGNANSQVGVPITVCAVPPDAGIGVIEMGISEPGEMEKLAAIVRCDAAIVTCIDISHMANLKSRENIMREKLMIAKGMPPGSKLILNGNDDLLQTLDIKKLSRLVPGISSDIEIRFFGTLDNAYYRASDISEASDGISCALSTGGKPCGRLSLNVPGRHMLMNALAACAAADIMGADMESALISLRDFSFLDGRGKKTVSGGVSIINDAYNASPASMRAGLSVLDKTIVPSGARRIAVLSDMLELGEKETDYHRDTGYFVARETSIDILYTYGPLSRHMADAAESGRKSLTVRHFSDMDHLRGELLGELKKGDAVFFKASNSMGISRLAQEIAEELALSSIH